MRIRLKLREAIRIQPGDYVAVVLNRDATTEEIHQLTSQMRKHWPDVQCVIFPHPTDVKVLRPDREARS